MGDMEINRDTVSAWLRNRKPDKTWMSPREWLPELEERVADDREDSRGARGAVVHVEMGGPHFADLDFWVTVLWDDGVLERHIASHWLYRMDGTQSYPRA